MYNLIFEIKGIQGRILGISFQGWGVGGVKMLWNAQNFRLAAFSHGNFRKILWEWKGGDFSFPTAWMGLGCTTLSKYSSAWHIPYIGCLTGN